MRIAYVTETFPPELNGVALTVERTIRHLRGRGHVVDLIRPRQPGDPASAIPAADDPAGTESSQWLTAGWPIPQYPELRFGFATASALKRRFREAGPDLVHLATPGPLAWNALHAARSLNIATSSDFRTNFHSYSGYYHLGVFAALILRALRRFHNRTERTFVPTRSVHRELAAAGFKNLTVVGRGVDTERFCPERRSAELRERWGAAANAPVLLSVGRIAAEKNIGLALRSFDALRRREPAARMVVVGEGPLRQRLEAENPAVHFAGVQRGEMLAACYASADIFVFPSLSETFGNVTLEALASGLPVVAYDTAAAGEHVAHRVSGLIVAPGDERAFENAVCSLALRPQPRAAMREQAVMAAHHLRWDDVLGRFEHYLQETIDAHQTPSAAVAVVA